MKNLYSVKSTILAVFLILVLALSVPADIITPEKIAADNSPLAQNQNSASVLNTQTEAPVQPVSKTEVFVPDTNISDEYKPETEIPFSAVSPLADDSLPVAEEAAKKVKTTTNTTTGSINVPATLNNVMLDNLPSILAKKVYTFSIDSRGAIKYAFNHTEVTKSPCLWYITLYEEYSPDGTKDNLAYRVINRTSYDTVGIGVQSSAIGVLPGNYKVEVECTSGFTDIKYQIAIGFAETSFYEAEPNNSFSRYTELPVNRTINGSASVMPNGVSDTDCYLFRITDTGYTVLYFEHEDDPENIKDNVAWRITLTDQEGNEYFYATSTMEKSMINSGIMGLSPGYYYVTVASHMYSNIEYSLNVSFTQNSAIEAELNETPETATPIEMNTEKVGALTYRYNTSDRDYFSFTMQNDGFVVVDFIHEAMTESKNGWNVSVLSEDGRLIYSSVSDWSQAILQTPNIGLTAGRYYIRIDSDNLYHNSMVYRLAILSVQNSDWETEPNNTPDDADIITLGAPINGTLIETGVNYDKDWFKVTATENTKVSISFSHIKTNESDKEGWIISLVDSSGNIIKTVTSDWNEDEISFTANLQPGSYYILIETGLHFSSNRYVLTVK